ncbi:MAG TPA: hypothetical protein VFE88_01415 [Candidatus Nanoarchaeia archaeon]|nr:hypothetical protein [Candidatus Nanoarchaeia archaeon]
MKKQTENKENWFKRNKELIEFLMVFFTFLMVVAVFFQAYQSAQQVKESKRAIDLEYTPQIAIEINSNRIPVLLTETSHTKADYFQVFRSDIIKQEIAGVVTNTSELSILVNITFSNLGSVGTKLERIRYDFRCDPKGEKDWQVDIMKKRILLPSEEIYYSNRLFLDFGKIPTSNKWCKIKFKFYFFDNYMKEIDYRVWYQNYDSEITRLEREIIR